MPAAESQSATEVQGNESYAKGPDEPPLLVQTIGANLEQTVAEHGDREALVESPRAGAGRTPSSTPTSTTLARGLIAAGIAKGDRVGIWAPNCAEWTLVQYATAKIGAILVNVNPAYRTHELAYVLNQSGIRLLVSATQLQDAATTARWSSEVRGECPALQQVVFLGHRRLGRSWWPAGDVGLGRRR